MGNGIFIIGTDTGVGKTLFTGCLAWKLSQLRFKVAVYKPVQSGGIKEGNKLISPDLKSIKDYSGLSDDCLFNSYCFKKESSPHLAAELEKENIDISVIRNKYNELIQKYDYVLVEGAGGLIVPVLRDYTILDLVSDLKVPIILVARSGLGTINHTSLTINCLKQNNIKVIGVVLNYYKGGTIEEDNRKTIEGINQVPILGLIPYYDKLIKNNILDDFKKNIDVDGIVDSYKN